MNDNNPQRPTNDIKDQEGESNNGNLIIMHQNIQSIRNKNLEIEVFLSTIDQKPNVLCFTEHWLEPSEEESIKINGYTMTSCFSRTDMEHGGTCIYTDEYLDFDEVACIKEISLEGHAEISCVQSKEKQIIVICVYRRGLGDFDSFIEKLMEVLEVTYSKFKTYKLVLCGDFNVDLLTNTSKSKEFLDLLNSYNISQTIFQPTRVTGATSSLIDNIFVNFDNFGNSSVLVSALSDHRAQILTIPVKKDQVKNIKKRIFSKIKMEQYRRELESVQWEPLFNIRDTNSAYDFFIKIIKDIMDRVFPMKNLNKTNSTKKWITQGIKISCKKKRQLYEQVRLGQTSKKTYKLYADILSKVIKQAKKMYNINYIASSENKGKATWALVKKVTSDKENPCKNTILENIHCADSDSVTILNQANNYFLNACPDVKANSEVDYKLIKKCLPSIFMYGACKEEIIECIKKMKNKKSTGEDEVPVDLLKAVADIIADPLVHIINLAFSTGVYPEKLKMAHIKAIYKKGETGEIKNYRPISLLSNINKIIEKIIYNRLIQFFEKNCILSHCQNGFRKGKTTIKAIYDAIVKVLNSLNNNKKTQVMCLDLSKAFDSVDHAILLEKLNLYGIRGVSLDLVKSYLTNRKQRVVEVDRNGDIIESSIVDIKKGVPQGSILGPLLYILYTNELPNIVMQDMVMYADDTTVIFSENNIELSKQSIHHSIDALDAWFSANNLLLNIEKTHIINFRHHSKEHLEINYKQNEIKSTENVAFLGVYIDSQLNWKEHVQKLAISTAKYCFALKVLAESIGQKEALIAYHAFVQSRLKYGIIFWGNSVEVQRIFVLQKRCLRNIFKMKRRESCKQIFKKQKILTLTCLYIYDSAAFIFENKCLFETYSHTHNTRYKENFKPEMTNYSYIQNNVQHCAVKIWNKLPQAVRNRPKRLFKLQLKQYLLDKAYYTLTDFLLDSIYESDF